MTDTEKVILRSVKDRMTWVMVKMNFATDGMNNDDKLIKCYLLMYVSQN
jgi:hypothetical protein